MAVLVGVLDSNPVRDVSPIKSKNPPAGARALTAEQLRALLAALGQSEFCTAHDLVDPVTLLVATGLRRSELLALRWVDIDDEACTLEVAGKIVRAKGVGLSRVGRRSRRPACEPSRCLSSRWRCPQSVPPNRSSGSSA